MYKSSIPSFMLACILAHTALGTTIKLMKQDPLTVAPGSSVSLTCTVNGVSHRCNHEGTIKTATAVKILEWHIPEYLTYRVFNGSNYGKAPFDTFSPQSFTFTSDCINGSLSSTLTFVANKEFKNIPFQCALVIDPNHSLNCTGLVKLWSPAIPLNVTVNTTCSTCPECLTVNTTCSTCPECSTLPPNTTVTTEPCAVTSITEDNIACTMCQTTCPPHGAALERSASILSLMLLLGLLIIMVVNLL